MKKKFQLVIRPKGLCETQWEVELRDGKEIQSKFVNGGWLGEFLHKQFGGMTHLVKCEVVEVRHD